MGKAPWVKKKHSTRKTHGVLVGCSGRFPVNRLCDLAHVPKGVRQRGSVPDQSASTRGRACLRSSHALPQSGRRFKRYLQTLGSLEDSAKFATWIKKRRRTAPKSKLHLHWTLALQIGAVAKKSNLYHTSLPTVKEHRWSQTSLMALRQELLLG